MTLYDEDLVRWTFEQGAALRAGLVMVAELEHIAEILEDMGNSEMRIIERQLARLLMRLLKWEYQPERRGNSWRGSIAGARKAFARRAGSGILVEHARAEFAWCYDLARDEATAETGLDHDRFPHECPWTFEQVMDVTFYPCGPA